MFFFFFKQKTAYEMRISDWSSDVCSSDLSGGVDSTAKIKRRRGRSPDLRRLHDPQRVPPFGQQLDFARPGLVQVRFLDVAVAADVFGNAGEDRKSVV